MRRQEVLEMINQLSDSQRHMSVSVQVVEQIKAQITMLGFPHPGGNFRTLWSFNNVHFTEMQPFVQPL